MRVASVSLPYINTRQIFREFLTNMMEDPHSVPRPVIITFAAKYLERVADHATNVAKLAVYFVEGKINCHSRRKVTLKVFRSQELEFRME